MAQGMTGLRRYLAWGLVGALLTGCGGWVDVEDVEAVVWSDDDEEVAYAIQKWEEIPGGQEELFRLGLRSSLHPRPGWQPASP